MEILINHQLATLKEGTSFDFVAENRYFSGADSYTLAITYHISAEGMSGQSRHFRAYQPQRRGCSTDTV